MSGGTGCNVSAEQAGEASGEMTKGAGLKAITSLEIGGGIFPGKSEEKHVNRRFEKGKIVSRVTLGRDERKGMWTALRFLNPAKLSFGAIRFPPQNDSD